MSELMSLRTLDNSLLIIAPAYLTINVEIIPHKSPQRGMCYSDIEQLWVFVWDDRVECGTVICVHISSEKPSTASHSASLRQTTVSAKSHTYKLVCR